MTFPTREGPWELPAEVRAQLRDLFPDLDLDTNFRHALAWLLANEERQKTHRGMPRYLTSWMLRASLAAQPGAVRKGSPNREPVRFEAPRHSCDFHDAVGTTGKKAPRFAEWCSECKHVQAATWPRKDTGNVLSFADLVERKKANG